MWDLVLCTKGTETTQRQKLMICACTTSSEPAPLKGLTEVSSKELMEAMAPEVCVRRLVCTLTKGVSTSFVQAGHRKNHPKDPKKPS